MVFLIQDIPCSTPKKKKRSIEKPFGCVQCGKQFSRLPYLQQHEKYHANKKAFKCAYCPKQYSMENRLKRHSVIHQQEDGQFKCDLCEKMFNKKSTYLGHLEVHNSIYKCPHCPKQLKTKYALKTHMLKHTAAPQISCKFCPKKYFTEARRKQHVKSKHSDRMYEKRDNNNDSGISSLDM